MQNFFQISLLILISKTFALHSNNYGLHPNTGLNTTEMITKYGYPVETHELQTEDGYILTAFRIPHGKNETLDSKETAKPPILLMHGLLSSAADWVNSGPDLDLSFMLADTGYDVWFGNQRGNIYSRKHIQWDIEKNKRQFFNFSFHEIGYYDIPATIDYILNATEQEQLFYVGISQGTTTFFVMTSERPEYNAKINLMVALAPVTYMTHSKSPLLRTCAKYYWELAIFFDLLEIDEFLEYHPYYLDLAKSVCNGTGPAPDVCLEAISLLTGFDYDQWDPTIMTVLMSNGPAGSSLRQHKHFLQIHRSGRFQHYDHGSFINLERYGTEEPPIYDLTKVTAPVAVYYGQNDWLSNITDAERMMDELSNVVVSRIVPYPKFNHMDFIYAVDVVKLLYNDVLSDLKNYTSFLN